MLEHVSGPSAEPINTAYVKSVAIIDTSADDSLLGTLITVARQAAEKYANKVFPQQTFKQTLDEFPTAIKIEREPLISITSVKYDDVDGVEQTLTASDYVVRYFDRGTFLYPTYGTSWPAAESGYGKVRVVYEAGYSIVPEAVKHAIALIVSDQYRDREGHSTAELKAVPYSAERLLDFYSTVKQ